MGKKLVTALVLAALAALLAVPAFAADDNSAKAWFESRFKAKKDFVDQAVKDGRITAEQGEAWKKHFDEMYKFHEENGFVCPMGGPGMGKGMGFGQGNGAGFGPGKRTGGGMGGRGFQQAPAPALQ
ncbi:MAG: YckD family protein [Peptococcaceae bacterium]|nr:YckD family protein [Peptococcaceae bacterium]